ncbi:MAG: hypothetical protein KIT83_22260, partial [Bryobacterales bacterium]|nr:hypothetical protein [Bryobacterales bacterium]
ASVNWVYWTLGSLTFHSIFIRELVPAKTISRAADIFVHEYRVDSNASCGVALAGERSSQSLAVHLR